MITSDRDKATYPTLSICFLTLESVPVLGDKGENQVSSRKYTLKIFGPVFLGFHSPLIPELKNTEALESYEFIFTYFSL